MINAIYKHDHDCAWKDKHVTLRPTMHGDYYVPSNAPVCVQTKTELPLVEIVHDEQSDHNMGEIVMGEEPKSEDS